MKEQCVRTIAITSGEPAGIGPDLVVQLAQQAHACALVGIGDADLLQQRARQLGLPLHVQAFTESTAQHRHQPGTLQVIHVPLREHCEAGVLQPHNAQYVLDILQCAIEGCQQQRFSAVVTCPLHKAVINAGGIPFRGHTEFFAQQTQSEHVVMLLASEHLRVALATTHIPLAEVAASIQADSLEKTLRVLAHDLTRLFGVVDPYIGVCGLNPHAGENGYMGQEEQTILRPLLAKLRQQGMRLSEPLSADTAFVPAHAQQFDAILAMYHDQGLPALKASAFGHIVNVTLGLPIIRTSVDHGTALALAGTGKANSSSVHAALVLAQQLVEQARHA